MKDIVWYGEERELPGYGMAVKGQVKSVPNKMADSYVKQGLAKFKAKKKDEKPSVSSNQEEEM